MNLLEGKVMKRILRSDLKTFIKYIMLALVCVVLTGLFAGYSAHAEEEEDYPDDYWNFYNGKVYKGQANATVNVRLGPGTDYDKQTDENKKNLQLSAGEEVTIFGEGKASDDGNLWYHIRIVRDGMIYYGWSSSTYVSRGNEEIRPTQAPATPTPSPTPSPTPVLEVTEAPTPTMPLLDGESDVPQNDKDSLLRTILIVILVAVLVLIGLIVFKILRDRKNKKSNVASRKVDKLKKMNLDNKDSNRKLPQIKKIEGDNAVAEEIRQDVYYKKTYDYSDAGELTASAEKESDEKRMLRAAIERLQEHDIVYHTIYGEGEVYDNSDVKLLEVRFGNDMRFLKKDQLVAKHELMIVDEEEQSIAKRRNRRRNPRT